MWYRYCQDEQGIDDTSGLPCSLLHLLASALDSDVEDRLLRWQMEPGNSMMCMRWDASRFAGIIMVREFRKGQGLSVNPDSQVVAMSVHRVMTILRELRPYMDVHDTLSNWDNILFPLVAVGSQTQLLTPDDRAFIRECILLPSHSFLGYTPHNKAVVLALDTYWATNGEKTLEQVTRDLGLELGLF
jgi:hypothetical protein